MTAVAVASDPICPEFSVLDPGGEEFFFWDFTAELTGGETIVSATVSSISKTDQSNNSSTMVPGTATVLNGRVVKQLIDGAGGTLGSKYILTAYGTTDMGQTLPLSAIVEIGYEFGEVT